MTTNNYIGTNRIQQIDFFKGISLFGILFVNVWLSSSSLLSINQWSNQFSSTLDPLLVKISSLLFEQRFVGIFSLVFGLGVALQQRKLDNHPYVFGVYYFKRTIILALLGTINMVFLFWGDILLTYASLSVILFVVIKLPKKFLLTCSILIYLVPTLLFLIPSIRMFIFHYEEGILKYYTPEALTKIYQSGSLLEIIAARTREFINYGVLNIVWQRTSLSFMIFGYWLGLNNFHLDFSKAYKSLKIAFILSSIYCFGIISYNIIGEQSWIPGIVHYFLHNIFIPVSVLCYLVIFHFIYQSKWLIKINTLVSNLGKLSLSNYLFQCLVCSILFTNVGFALYFKTTPTYNLLIALAIYVIQIVITHYYLKRFKNGPLENLVHTFVYPKTTN